ncbi:MULTISPECIES: helix-turn-helix transcriptional regulator [Streptomyces]|uniref:Helix-turn-helix transcriptional regulator n=1 Tax=Streptomyces albidocamelliae TaxID=2981135 RepID=A0ABY6EF91_9ACTN|nr:helix-turn-helix transcriptional regulator [Streptomyces sp. HUAS 14-6]UXY33544.1 helix-turn-helix transcriptional regulator [Streptomyces sp. HUAS 14-6]
MSELAPETALREFLRTRRARLTPEQTGLPAHPGLPRSPGLRREEVAQLAGVSADYYVRLEAGRGAGVSPSVLRAVARALQLDDTERDHLFALVEGVRQRPHAVVEQQARLGLVRALDNISDVPALLLGHRLDVLATNRLARALHLDFDGRPAEEWNMARYMFLSEAARELCVDWAETAREIVGMLRLYAGHHPHDPTLDQLVSDLSADDRDFRGWWAGPEVYLPRYGVQRYRHPLAGDLTLGFEVFTPLGDDDQTLGLYTVEPGSPSEKALLLLAG